jgi:hypothetical protein
VVTRYVDLPVPAVSAPPTPELPIAGGVGVGVDEDFPNPKLVPLEPFAFCSHLFRLKGRQDYEEGAGVEGGSR